LLSVGFGVASFAQIVSKILPTSGILNETMWVVLVASTVSILLMKTLSTNGKLMRYKNTFFTKKFSRKK
ncbi:sporulation integral membrane protein YlbJ, partial [Clostridioides difficile]